MLNNQRVNRNRNPLTKQNIVEKNIVEKNTVDFSGTKSCSFNLAPPKVNPPNSRYT